MEQKVDDDVHNVVPASFGYPRYPRYPHRFSARMRGQVKGTGVTPPPLPPKIIWNKKPQLRGTGVTKIRYPHVPELRKRKDMIN